MNVALVEVSSVGEALDFIKLLSLQSLSAVYLLDVLEWALS